MKTPVGPSSRYLLPLFVSTLITALWLPPEAAAQPANEPLQQFVVTDGAVSAMTIQSNVLYLGGLFSQAGLRTGSGAPVSADTGVTEAIYPRVSGDVNAVIADGQGGWFVGGQFYLVGNSLRANLVHIKSDRTVDANWSPPAIGGWVDALQLSGDTLYVAGSFTNVNGQTRNRAAALDRVSGALKSWNPNLNGIVRAMLLSTTNIFLGGEFTSVGGQTRNYIAAVDLASGTVTGWNPGAEDRVQAMVISAGHLYTAGYFTAMSGQSRSCGASFDLATGTLDAWNPAVGGIGIVSPAVFAISAWQNTICLGGVFGSAGGSNRVDIAALDATTAQATAWDARLVLVAPSGIPVNRVTALYVYSNVLYVGGQLGDIGGQSRTCAAALDLTSGNATSWDPKLNMQADAFCGTGNTIYLGGAFSAINCVPRTNTVAFNLLTRQITAWSPVVATRSGIPINAMLAVSNRMYIGGFFTNVNGLTRSNLVAVDLAGGTLLSWTPNPPSTIFALATWSNRLFVGGGFTSISGTARTNFAEFNLATGALTAWDPAFRSLVQALAVNSNTLYAGGLFSTVSGQSRRRVAAFELTSDTLTSWDAGITNGSQVDAIAIAANRIYLGGRFAGLSGGYKRTNFVALDLATAQVLPLTADTDGQPVYALAATSNQVFIAGNFWIIAGQSRTALAALDVNSNTLTAWNPNPENFMLCATIYSNVLYVGGANIHLGNESVLGVGAFPLVFTGLPVIVANSARCLNGHMQFQLSAPNAPQATVLVSSNFSNWQTLQTVPLVSGNGICVDSGAAGFPRRFYRVRVP